MDLLTCRYLEASLGWNCFEQACMWQLIDAEETPIEMLVGILPELKLKKHTEALTHLLLQIRARSPQAEIVKPVLCMDLEGASKNFSVSLFKTWCNEEARDLALTLAQLLSKPQTGSSKRKSSSSSKTNPSKEQILLHLNKFYQHCQDSNDMTLFNYEALRYAVTNAKKTITDPELKAKCKPLFLEFNELPNRVSRKRKTQRRTRGRVKKEESSGESASEEEEESGDESEEEVEENKETRQNKNRPPTKKRRKPSKHVSSDEED